MPSTANQPLSESTLLNRYLLTPSSLPTILPYNTFLGLLPTSTRNDTDLQPHLRRLYADLQFQRNLDLDTVRANIARECARAGTVKATLRKDLARELGGGNDGSAASDAELEVVDMDARSKRDESVELAPSRKRKRAPATGEEDDGTEDNRDSSPQASHSEDEEADEDEDDIDASRQLRREEGPVIPESPSSSAPTSPSEPPPASNTQPSQTHYDTALDTAFHGPRGLALPSVAAQTQPHQHYHTRTSLLSAMETAIADLQSEIANLETEAAGTMDGLRETVGGLSDLRYGKLSRDSDGTGLERDVEEGLRTLREVAERKLQDI